MSFATFAVDSRTKLHRLRAMGAAEILTRGRQEIAKQLERLGVNGRPRPAPGFHQDVPFFPGADSEAARALLASRLPLEQGAVLAFANDALRNHFNLLGHRLFFGDPVDWHFDPLAGRRAPFSHWSRIDPLDPASVGDSKVVWELNRHQWLVNLGQAYRLTGDERFAQACAARLRDWMRANPQGMGLNWASSLEVALRLISWCWILFLFRGSKAFTPALCTEMSQWLHAHASHVERYLSYYFSPNTHLTGEALGLVYAGVVFPEGRDAARWRALGSRILVEQIERQVLPDGVYFEQSTCYQRYTVEIYLHFLILARRNGVQVPAVVAERVQGLLDCLLALRGPDGSVPQIGDTDGGALLPLVRRSAGDLRGVFATAAAFFARPDYAWAAQGLASEVVWLLGLEGCETFDALQPAPPAAAPSRLFAQGGYAVLRDGWGADAHQLILDTGPLGCHVSGGHGHADLLSLQCAVFGEPCVVDPGTCSYADTPWRDYFRGTAAHSTVRVDGLDQAEPAGPFKWGRRPSARLRRWVSTAAFDLVDAEHDAYRRLADPVTHRRRVFFGKPRYWVVVDDLYGAGEHRIELRFQFAPVPVTLDAGGQARARLPGGRECRILVVSRAPLQAELAEGRLHPIQGWVSPDYGRRQPAPALTYSTAGALPLRLVTLLLPVEPASAAPPAVTVSAERIDLRFADRCETLLIGEQDIAVRMT